MPGHEGSLLIPVPDGSSFALLSGRAPLSWCFEAMADGFETVVVPVARTHAADARACVPDEVLVVEVDGAATRVDCLRAALTSLSGSSHVVVHDLERPLTPRTVLDRVVDALPDSELVVPTLVVVDSVKAIDENGTVVATVDRSTLRSTQFPRGMTVSFLRRAVEAGEDEVVHAVRVGVRITSVDGDPHGFEVRTPHDTALAEAVVVDL
ncbi:2-C-methyl-D-erythritol 4-phosphate cytidylyltransferase [Actinomycetes bacterium M1A6_2h]